VRRLQNIHINRIAREKIITFDRFVKRPDPIDVTMSSTAISPVGAVYVIVSPVAYVGTPAARIPPASTAATTATRFVRRTTAPPKALREERER
jgi:hypothetical protein